MLKQVHSKKESSISFPIELDERIRDWFKGNIGEPTELQGRVWQDISDGNNVLVVSPTGTGKTLSAIIPPVNDILKGRSQRSSTSIVYISPMKALGADLVKTLKTLSDGLGRIEGKKERKWGRGRKKKDQEQQDAKLHIGIRTGDVSQTERRHLLLDPPDILVTTPENLLLMLCSKARNTLSNTRYIVIDEVHEMVPSKRGALLSLCVEYLSTMVVEEDVPEPVRIGLSATIRPETTAAKFLGGYRKDGRPREVRIIKETSSKETKISIRTLTGSIEGDEETTDRIIDDIGNLIKTEKGSMVVFHNTRRSAEKTAYRLIENGHSSVMPHHGSLGIDVRKAAEEGLKKGELKAIVSSTSLELGLDIGLVDLVCQISSPKDPGRLLQRFGRSGHSLEGSSRGIIYPMNGVDLLECLAVTRSAQKNNLKKLEVPNDPMDVLGQFIIGMSIREGGTTKKEIKRIARSTYPFRKMRSKDLDSLLELLSLRMRGAGSVSPRLWFDPGPGTYLPRRNTKQAFYLNCGTIPKETTYKVIDEKNHRHLGELSRDFGETLYERDVILIGSRPHRIIGFSGTKIMVKEEPGSHATVPSWSGEINPRSLDVSREMLRLIRDGKDFSSRSAGGIVLRTDDKGRELFTSIINRMIEKGIDPSMDKIPIEEVRTGRTKREYIFHLPLGRNITEPLARSLSYGIRRKLGARADYFAVDNGFSISSPRKLDVDTLKEAFGEERFMDTIKELVLGSSLFRTRFAHCLAKSLLVLSRFRGKDTSAMYRRSRTDKLLGLVTDTWYSEGGWTSTKGPMAGLILLAEESFKEVFNERIDLVSCKKILCDISRERIELDIIEDLKEPSFMGAHIMGGGRRESSKSKEKVKDEGSKEASAVDPNKGIDTSNDDGVQGSDGSTGSRIIAPPWDELEGEGLGWIDPDTLSYLDSSKQQILGERFSRLYQQRGPVSSMSWLPYCTHPISILKRSRGGEYRDIRSAVIGGRLVPGRLLSKDCLMDPKWKEAAGFISPSSDILSQLKTGSREPASVFERSEIGDLIQEKGDDLSSSIDRLMNCNELSRLPEEVSFHLGGEEGYHLSGIETEEGDAGEDRDVDVLTSFLRRFGPFTIAEISSIFNWEPGEHPPVLESAYALGRIDIDLGPSGVTEGSSNWKGTFNNLWISPKAGYHPYKEIEPKDNDRVFMLPSSDPAVSMIHPDDSWIEDERVRGGKNRKLTMISKDGSKVGYCHILETSDMVRIIQVEVDDYEMIESSALSLLGTIECYERLGYEVFTIEGFLGIPAGEAAEIAVKILLDSGFSRTRTPKGQILVKGCPVKFGLSRSSILREILKRQGLLPGHHLEHPLQIILALGSVNDRWELLSRLGSVRYPRASEIKEESIRDLISDGFKGIRKSVDSEDESSGILWDPITSNGSERLSDQKDLAKRFSLRKGMMDQPGEVWSLIDLFKRFPRPTCKRSDRLQPGEGGILQKINRGPRSELDGYIRTHGLLSCADSLLKEGMLLEDAWGKYEYPFRDGRIGDEPLPSLIKVPKGRMEEIWTLKHCSNLGIFTVQDLINYSPNLVHRSKLKKILSEITGKHLTRFLSPDLGMSVVYTLNGIEVENGESEGDEKDAQGLILISPRDRISRVVSPDIRIRLSRVSGFSVFRGEKAVALISIKKMKKAFKNTGFGEPVKGSSHLENYIIKKAWVDLRFRKKELLREIKKAFFNMGYQLVTDDEKLKIESLYRDIEKQESMD